MKYESDLYMEEKKTRIRDEFQTEAVDTLMARNRVVLNWGTGVGKSRVAVRAMELIYDADPSARILLMVQETAHKDNWRAEVVEVLGEAKADLLLRSVAVDCYASLKKHANTSWDLIIFDEGHHLRSPLRQTIVMTMKASRVLILTATISDNNDGDLMVRTLINTFGPFVFMKKGLQEAIDSGILGKPEIHLIPVVLDNERRNKYNNLTGYYNEKKNEYFSERDSLGLSQDSPDTPETDKLKFKWLNAGARRKQMLGHAKTGVARHIINTRLKGSRFICFCTSLKQIEWLHGTNFVSSENTAKENHENIKAFNEGRSDSLFAMGMLQEGQNLAGIEAGLIIQLDGKARPFIQKFGRVMRSKSPVQYILYVQDTHDENYLTKAISGIDRKYIVQEPPVLPDGTPAPDLLKPSILDRLDAEEEGEKTRPRIEPKVSAEWNVDQKNGVFTSLRGGAVNYIHGTPGRISSDEHNYRFVLKDAETGLTHTIILFKKLAISVLLTLATATPEEMRGDIGISVSCSTDGKWAVYELFAGKKKLAWNKRDMANYREAFNKIDFLDRIADRINFAIPVNA